MSGGRRGGGGTDRRQQGDPTMRWQIDDTPEQAAFREEMRAWLRAALPKGWTEAIDAGDDERYSSVRSSAEAEGWNVFSWSSTIGASGYAAPLWPKEY